MTMVRLPRHFDFNRIQVAGKFLWAALVFLVTALPVLGQGGPVHWLHAGAMPPGAIGRQRLIGDGPLSFFYQPVEVRAPEGARIAYAVEGGFALAQKGHLLVGLQVGTPYRLRVTHIPGQPGLEIFPTVEIIDRLYPPPGQALRFPIPIELTSEELALAADGHFVTRVIYLENPQAAMPLAQQETIQDWVEARPGEDPLIMADHLGRPMAILRLGGRLPVSHPPDHAFLYGAPPIQQFEQPTDSTPKSRE